MQVADVQRARILAAMVRVVAEQGVGSVTVARVVARAGVSRRTFYEQFSGCEDCFLAVFEDTVERASQIATAAVASAPSAWCEQVRAGLAVLLGFFDEEPALGSLLVVDALAAGPSVLERRARVLETLTATVDQGRGNRRSPSAKAKNGRGASSSSSSPPPLTAEGVVGAVLSVIHARLLLSGWGGASRSRTQGAKCARHTSERGRRDTPPIAALIGLLNPLMAIIVLPYLGQAAAVKELAHPAMLVRRGGLFIPAGTDGMKTSRPSPRDPLQDLNMRLTYRTLMVLSAIATNPGASNRQVAEQAGVYDQGQISKLLARLEKLGLIANSGHGQPRGEPNAWTLTPRGQEVEQTIRT